MMKKKEPVSYSVCAVVVMPTMTLTTVTVVTVVGSSGVVCLLAPCLTTPVFLAPALQLPLCLCLCSMKQVFFVVCLSGLLRPLTNK